jgi:hypothetical protein
MTCRAAGPPTPGRSFDSPDDVKSIDVFPDALNGEKRVDMRRSRSSGWKLATFAVVNAIALALMFTFTFAFVPSASPPAHAAGLLAQAANGTLKPAQLMVNGKTHMLPFFSAGTLEGAQSALKGTSSVGVTDGSLGCSDRNAFHDGSVRVNQDCTYRRQAEESIAANPVNPNNLIAGQNDSQIGFNHCGFDYSLNGGESWGSGLPPFWQHFNNPAGDGVNTIAGGAGTNHTYDFASDPALTFDSEGNAYFSCVVLDVNDNASSVMVTMSPASAHGSFYNNVPAAGNTYIVAEDNSPNVSHDKEFIVADSFTNSPFRDNVYVTWTVFLFSNACGGYCSSPIFFSRSTDHAQTWSKPIEISGDNPNLCLFGNAFDTTRSPSACDFDQGSDPVVLPNGTIVVTFNNGNTPSVNNQQLAVRSTDGGVTWSQPTKVGDDIAANEPFCSALGRECIPGPQIRTDDFPLTAVDRKRGTLYSVWQDFRSGSEFDIQLAQSTDGGVTWTDATSPVNASDGHDHYMPAVGVASSGRVAVSYYRSPIPTTAAQVGTLGQEYFLAGGKGVNTPFKSVRVAAMTPAPDGNQAGFNGDYSGLVVVGDVAHPIWSDTRNAVPASVGAQGVTHDEDIFTIALEVPGY